MSKTDDAASIISTTCKLESTGALSRKVLSATFITEMKRLCKFSIPITLTTMLGAAMAVVSVIFTGRLGENELAAVGLAISIFNVAGFSIMHGLLSTCITVFSQTFGSGNKLQLGIELQKALYITTMCCLPCCGVFLYIEPLLLAIKVHPRISKMVADYLILMMPGMLFASIACVFEKFVQSQNKIIVPMCIGLLANSINALLHYILLFQMHIGISGSAIAQSCSYLFATILNIGYVYFSNLYKSVWIGYSPEMWLDWGSWIYLGVPGLVMVALKWWYFELCLIFIGTVGVTELAAQTLLINLSQIVYTLLSVGLGVACSIIVGQSLGAGKHLVPMVSTCAGLVLTILGMLLVGIILLPLQGHVPTLFTTDAKVIATAAECIPYLTVFLLFHGMVGVMGGAMRGAGMQPIAALFIFICLYIIAAPLGICLLLLTELKLRGLWIGFVVGMSLITFSYMVILMKTDWQHYVREATKRAKVSQGPEKKTIEALKAMLEDGEVEILENCSSSRNDIVDNDLMKQSTELSKERVSTRYLAFSRSLFTGCMVLVPIGGIIFKCCMPLERIFGEYCLFHNGTFLSVQLNGTTTSEEFAQFLNCTIFVP